MTRWKWITAALTLLLLVTACSTKDENTTEPLTDPVTEITTTEISRSAAEETAATDSQPETAEATEPPSTELLSDFDRSMLLNGFDSETIEKLRALKERREALEAPYIAAIEAENALLRALTEQDQSIWNRFWEHATEEEYTVRPFEAMVQGVGFLAQSEKDQVISSHNKRAAISERISAIYYDMYEAAAKVNDEWQKIWDKAERIEVNPHEIDPPPYLADYGWLYQEEALSDSDRERYLEIVGKMDAVNLELDPILLEFSRLRDERQEEFSALNDEYDRIYKITDPIWAKIYAEQPTEGWEWPMYSDTDPEGYYRAFTMLSKEEQDALILADKEGAELAEKMSALEREILESRPELLEKQEKLFARMTEMQSELSAILEKVNFWVPEDTDVPAEG